MAERIVFSPPERRKLKRISRSRSLRAQKVRRVNIISALQKGQVD